VIFGFLLACYLLTYTGVIQSSDGLAMFATTESMVRRGQGDMNQLLWMGSQQGEFGPDGNLYSRKGLGMSLLALPLVGMAQIWDLLGLVQTALLLNPLLTALTGALIFRAALRLGWQRNTAIASALIFGLATMAWPYTQTLFSDPVCAFGLFAAFYGLYSFGQTGRKRYLLAGAVGWGIAYLARSINLATLPIYFIGLWLALVHRARLQQRIVRGQRVDWRLTLRQQWRPLVTFAIPVVIAGLVSLWWNWLRYGDILETGYAATETFSAPWLSGIWGLIAGPARGFFWYNPVLLLALPGAVWFWRRAPRVLAIVVALSVVYVLTYGKWYMWHGGYSWGPRFLVPIIPFVALLVGPTWQRLIADRNWGWLGVAVTIGITALSVAVQVLGMLIPFGLVQDWLAANVQPLFAPETFTRLQYSPLVLQWQFISSDSIIFAWWRGGQGWGAIDWLALAIPLTAVLVGVFVLVRQVRWLREDGFVDSPRNTLYMLALVAIGLALLTYHGQAAATSDNALVAKRIDQAAQPDDAILHLRPTETQQFSNSYHGRLPEYGLTNGESVQTVDAWLNKFVADGHQRLWVVPDDLPPEASPWELALREDNYLLLDTRPAGQTGQRLALYALAGSQTLPETGLGTIFGDPVLASQEINKENGWFLLSGYRLTQETSPGKEILLTLRWQGLRDVDENYHVFVHLLNERGEKVAQRDGQPVQWLRPTSTWQPGEEIYDHYGIPLPADTPVGNYTIAVGLYDPVTGQRLPVSAGPGDYAIELGPVLVQNE
jgi:hypothetical protein